MVHLLRHKSDLAQTIWVVWAGWGWGIDFIRVIAITWGDRTFRFYLPELRGSQKEVLRGKCKIKVSEYKQVCSKNQVLGLAGDNVS